MHLSMDSIEFYLEQLEDELSNEYSDLEEFKLYSEMISRLNCGHTQVIPNRTIQAEWLLEEKALPFDMYLIGRRLVVGHLVPEDEENIERDNTPDDGSHDLPEDSEILAIDKLTVEQMVNAMGRYVSGDEGSIAFKYYQMAHMFEFYHHLALPLYKDSVRVDYVTPEFDTLFVYMQPGKAPIHSINARLAKYSQIYGEQEYEMGNFKIVNDEFAYFRFHSFSASSGKEYNAFLKNAFTKIKDQGIEYLVIDLRGNTGGVMQYEFMKYMVGEGVEIGRYVIAKPFEKSENKNVKKANVHFLRYAILSYQQKKKQNKGTFDDGIVYTDPVDDDLVFGGQVCVITDEGTFSSAAMLASQLKSLKNAKIVGRPAGGSFYSGNAGTLVIRLPHSKLELSINPNSFYSQLKPVTDRLAIKEPDVYLDPLIIDEEDQKQFYFKAAVSVFKD